MTSDNLLSAVFFLKIKREFFFREPNSLEVLVFMKKNFLKIGPNFFFGKSVLSEINQSINRWIAFGNEFLFVSFWLELNIFPFFVCRASFTAISCNERLSEDECHRTTGSDGHWGDGSRRPAPRQILPNNP
jgi:hypothetical protein